ncbi:MAG TPA: NifU family protein [Gemmatimonadaceae bacterium]|nr:NifU family protein [Gemmatimonadaceae bacterium]
MPLFKRNARDIEHQIRQAIAAMRPLLRMDSVGVELVAFSADTGVALLRFEGDCPDCRLSASMLRQGIEAHLRQQVPEIREVRAAET